MKQKAPANLQLRKIFILYQPEQGSFTDTCYRCQHFNINQLTGQL